jgi:uncharacterized RDD family membrane protein YckC
MADVKLNKPLYKDEDFTPPSPRQPRASILGRGAALFLDIMLLRLVFAVIVRFAPDPVLALGPLAPWLGLLLGWLYFGIGFSRITLGRTLGKLILRVQVADISGPDLPLGRSFFRATALLWPLAVLLACRLVAEKFANTDPTSPYTTIEVFGWMLILGWALGNLGFAALDPFGRGVHDRLADSIVINAELEPAPVAEYLASAREAATQAPVKKSVTALGFAMAICLAFAAASSMEVMRQLRDLSPADKDRARAMVQPPYGRAWPAPPKEDTPTTGILPVNFNFRKRGKVDVAAIKADTETTRTLDRLIGATMSSGFAQELQEYMSSANLDRAKRGEKPTSAPEKLKFELGYAEYADLFFAAETHPVYTIGRIVDIPTTATKPLESAPPK